MKSRLFWVGGCFCVLHIEYLEVINLLLLLLLLLLPQVIMVPGKLPCRIFYAAKLLLLTGMFLFLDIRLWKIPTRFETWLGCVSKVRVLLK